MDQNKIAEFEISGRLGSLNEYINQCRKNVHCGNKYKHDQQSIVQRSLIGTKPIPEECYPVYIKYTYFEANKKRDLDNISSLAHKIIQDTLVTTGILRNDTMNEVCGFSDEFPGIDKEHPRIIVEIFTSNQK